VPPGTPVAARPDDEALAAITDTLLALWMPAPAGCSLPTVRQECTALYDEDAVKPLPAAVVHAARSMLDQLLRDPVEDRVLHGDLHQQNLLWSADRGWVAIDPHGVVGDPGYDVGPLLIKRSCCTARSPAAAPGSAPGHARPARGWVGAGPRRARGGMARTGHR
jgi:streptomycin 6-kinase